MFVDAHQGNDLDSLHNSFPRPVYGDSDNLLHGGGRSEEGEGEKVERRGQGRKGGKGEGEKEEKREEREGGKVGKGWEKARNREGKEWDEGWDEGWDQDDGGGDEGGGGQKETGGLKGRGDKEGGRQRGETKGGGKEEELKGRTKEIEPDRQRPVGVCVVGRCTVCLCLSLCIFLLRHHMWGVHDANPETQKHGSETPRSSLTQAKRVKVDSPRLVTFTVRHHTMSSRPASCPPSNCACRAPAVRECYLQTAGRWKVRFSCLNLQEAPF